MSATAKSYGGTTTSSDGARRIQALQTGRADDPDMAIGSTQRLVKLVT
jgi:hypothetical protein